jgi:hypothetical protein
MHRRSFCAITVILAIQCGSLLYPVALWLDGGFGVYEGLWVIVSLVFIVSGIPMIRDQERARLLKPGESERDRIEKVGWSNDPLAVLKGEALRSIGVFGLLFIPTMMIVVIVPSLSPFDLVVYLPAAVLTLIHAAAVAWIRITTDAGPHYTQVIDAVFGS